MAKQARGVGGVNNKQHNNNLDLPEGWEMSTLGEFVAKRSKGIVPNKIPDETFELYSVPSFDTGTPEIVKGGDIGSNKQIVREGAVLLCKINPRINRSWIVSSHSLNQKIASTEWITFPSNDAFEPRYLAYYLKQDALRDFLASNASGVGGSLMRVKPATVKDYPLPIAPENEQKRIVAEIEKQFSRLDEAVANLKRVKVNLKRYKASVLKAAVEGKLTEEWRKKHPDVEPADKLLERILAERRKKWEEAESARLHERAARRQAKIKAKGKEPKDDKWKKKYKEPVKPSGEDLTQIHITDISDSWVFCTADQLTTVVTDGEHITPTRSNKGIFLLSARNIQDGWISFEKVDYISKDVHEKLKQRLTINEGDVLMSCSGSVGRSCVAPKKPEFSLVRSVAALKPVIENGKFMSYSIRSTLLQSQINTKKTQTAQANIFQGKIRTLIFTLPPIQEQHAIIIQVEEKLSVADKFEFVVDNALKRAERLRQTILKKAFSGKLVPQNSSDKS